MVQPQKWTVTLQLPENGAVVHWLFPVQARRHFDCPPIAWHSSPASHSFVAAQGRHGPSFGVVVQTLLLQTDGGVQCAFPVHWTHAPAAPQCVSPGVVQSPSALHATQAPAAPQNGWPGWAAAHCWSVVQGPHIS